MVMCMVKWKSVMGGGSNVGWISTEYSKLHVLTGFPLSIVESPWNWGFPLGIVDSH